MRNTAFLWQVLALLLGLATVAVVGYVVANVLETRRVKRTLDKIRRENGN